MSEPKREPIMGDAAKLNEALLSAAEYGGDFNSLRYWLTRAAEAIHPAPHPEARAEPDYTCPKCGAKNHHTPTYFSMCGCPSWEMAAAANARIAELVRERDEAYRKGVAAAKEACAKRLEGARFSHPWRKEPNIMCFGNVEAARIVRETEVPDA